MLVSELLALLKGLDDRSQPVEVRVEGRQPGRDWVALIGGVNVSKGKVTILVRERAASKLYGECQGCGVDTFEGLEARRLDDGGLMCFECEQEEK